jgi:flagellar biosynthesis protein FlhB
MQVVPESNVLIANQTHFAVALKQEHDSMDAPEFVAKRILEVAKENDVPLVENAPLARVLRGSVQVCQPIPTNHNRAVTEVMGYFIQLRPKPKQT